MAEPLAEGAVQETVALVSPAVAVTLVGAPGTVAGVTGVAELETVTFTGTLELVVVPLPNGPLALYPQHWTVPPESSAQVCVAPAAIAVTPAVDAALAEPVPTALVAVTVKV